MIVNHQSQEVNMSGVESVAFAIEDSAMIYKLMYSTMFQDKEKVVLQELAANALDAHNAAGKKDIPIRITLPTELSPELVIEDEGIGMSYDTVCNVYPVYGRSLKSDNNSAIGGFGYGGKSPFSISDSYTVETTHKGVTTSVACYLDNAFPKFSVFNSGELGKPDGTVVRVPVSDTGKQVILKNKAEKLFILWDVKPTFHGARIEYTDSLIYENEDLLIYKSHTVSRNQYSYNRSLYQVAVGPYIYEIPESMVDKLRSMSAYNQLCEVSQSPNAYDVVFKFDIGELELSPSREWIENTPQNLETISQLIKTQMAVVTTTATPIGVDWYTRISDIIKKHGVWTQQVLPNCQYNIPLGVDATYVAAALKELRGTHTNPLTSNYDASTVWSAVMVDVKKTIGTPNNLAFSEAEVPRRSSELLQSLHAYDKDNNRVVYHVYQNLPTHNNSLESAIVRGLLGINSSGAAIRKVSDDKISAARSGINHTAGEIVNAHTFDLLLNNGSCIILVSDKQHKHVNSFLRQSGDGRYLVIETDDRTIGYLKTYFQANAEQLKELNLTFAYAEDLAAAHVKHLADLKLRRKTRVAKSPSTTKDPVAAVRYTDLVNSTTKELTRSQLVEFTFDPNKRYIISRKPISARSVYGTSLISSTIKDKCPNTLPNIEVFHVVDSSKSKTAWWTNFEQTASQYANVTFVEDTDTRTFLEYFDKLPETIAFEELLKTWESYVSLFAGVHGKGTLSVLARLHPVSYDIGKVEKYLPYYCHMSDQSKKLKSDLFGNPVTKTVFAKIYVAIIRNDITFLDLITDDEKSAYIKTINEYLKLDPLEDNP